MTAFAALIGVDQRGPASLYLASDSRVSWADSDFRTWDYGRKVFASGRYPDVVGYVGDVLFASLALGQIVAQLDAGVLVQDDAEPNERFDAIGRALRTSFGGLPQQEQRSFWVVYGGRAGEGMSCSFTLAVLVRSGSGWQERRIDMPQCSSHVLLLGSGATEIDRWDSWWRSSTQGRTTRAAFSAFCDAVSDEGDRHTGGAPQLVGVYRVGAARPFGVLWKGVPHLFGLPVAPGSAGSHTNVEWRNSLFERVARDGSLLPGAQRHHAPKGLGGARG